MQGVGGEGSMPGVGGEGDAEGPHGGLAGGGPPLPFTLGWGSILPHHPLHTSPHAGR